MVVLIFLISCGLLIYCKIREPIQKCELDLTFAAENLSKEIKEENAFSLNSFKRLES